jgi:hypothetical protein
MWCLWFMIQYKNNLPVNYKKTAPLFFFKIWTLPRLSERYLQKFLLVMWIVDYFFIVWLKIQHNLCLKVIFLWVYLFNDHLHLDGHNVTSAWLKKIPNRYLIRMWYNSSVFLKADINLNMIIDLSMNLLITSCRINLPRMYGFTKLKHDIMIILDK